MVEEELDSDAVEIVAAVVAFFFNKHRRRKNTATNATTPATTPPTMVATVFAISKNISSTTTCPISSPKHYYIGFEPVNRQSSIMHRHPAYINSI